MTATSHRTAMLAPLQQLTFELYASSNLSLADVARALHLTERRVYRWSARGGGWSAQRWLLQRDRRRAAASSPATVDVGRMMSRAASTLQRAGFTREDAARALLVHAAALVLEDGRA